jgi:hypothetical protein
MTKVLLALFSLLTINPALCAIIEVDIYSDGSNAGFQTSGSQLVWLDLGETQHKSFNQVIELTTEGGTFEGWRLPSQEEVVNMWGEALGSNLTWSWGVESFFLDEALDSDLVRYWYSLANIMGTTRNGVYSDSGVNWFSSIGIFEADSGLLFSSHFSLWQFYEGRVEGLIAPTDLYEKICNPSDSACSPRDYRNESLNFRSTMLVSELKFSVPEPHSLVLLGLVVFAIYRFRSVKV